MAAVIIGTSYAATCAGQKLTCGGMAGNKKGSCYDQCYQDNGNTGDPQMTGDNCDENLCCTDSNGQKPKGGGGEVPNHYYIDPRYYLQRTFDIEGTAYWDYSFSSYCRCDKGGGCGSSRQDSPKIYPEVIWRKWYWDDRNAQNGEAGWTNGAQGTVGHPNHLTFSSCITIDPDWGLITLKIGTKESDP